MMNAPVHIAGDMVNSWISDPATRPTTNPTTTSSQISIQSKTAPLFVRGGLCV
jgi:hypothetical protein